MHKIPGHYIGEANYLKNSASKVAKKYRVGLWNSRNIVACLN